MPHRKQEDPTPAEIRLRCQQIREENDQKKRKQQDVHFHCGASKKAASRISISVHTGSWDG